MRFKLRLLFLSFSVFFFVIAHEGNAQTHIDQKTIHTSVINLISALGTQAKSHEVATVSYNSHHWQNGGSMIIELFHEQYGTGYEKYFVEIGYGQGTSSTQPISYLVESRGRYHNAKVTLGSPTGTGIMSGGYEVKSIPVYVDVRAYSKYRVKLTYLRNRVSAITAENQIIVNETPLSSDISDFSPDLPIYDFNNDVNVSGQIRAKGWSSSGVGHALEAGTESGTGNIISYDRTNHVYKPLFIKGSTNTISGQTFIDSNTTIDGNLETQKVKVTSSPGSFPDYVFSKDYQLKSLPELEAFIKQNGHLPNIPTALEVEANGQDLGLIQQKLLEKIEELTLYVIELSKNNEQLLKRIQKFEQPKKRRN